MLLVRRREKESDKERERQSERQSERQRESERETKAQRETKRETEKCKEIGEIGIFNTNCFKIRFKICFQYLCKNW